MKLTGGKLRGLKAVSDQNGVIAAAAMDQRGSLHKSLAKEKGVPASSRSARGDDGLNSRRRSPASSHLMPVPSCWTPSLAWRPPASAPRTAACCWPMKRQATTSAGRAASQSC